MLYWLSWSNNLIWKKTASSEYQWTPKSYLHRMDRAHLFLGNKRMDQNIARQDRSSHCLISYLSSSLEIAKMNIWYEKNRLGIQVGHSFKIGDVTLLLERHSSQLPFCCSGKMEDKVTDSEDIISTTLRTV